MSIPNPETLRQHIEIARRSNTTTLRVYQCLQKIESLPEWKSILQAPASLRNFLLVPFTEEVGKQVNDPLTPRILKLTLENNEHRLPTAAPQTVTDTAVTENSKSKQEKTEQALKIIHAPSVAPAAPSAPVRSLPSEMPEISEKLKTLEKDWNLPDLAEYLTDDTFGIHARDLKKLLNQQMPDHLSNEQISLLLPRLNETPQIPVYRGINDPRNPESPLYDRWFDLQNLLEQIPQNIDNHRIASRLRESIGQFAHIDKRVIQEIRDGRFANGKDWLIEPSLLDQVEETLISLAGEEQTQEEPEETVETQQEQTERSEYPTTFKERRAALEKHFKGRLITTKEVQELFGLDGRTTVQIMIQFARLRYVEFVKLHQWKLPE